jgi:hypothetical protein
LSHDYNPFVAPPKDPPTRPRRMPWRDAQQAVRDPSDPEFVNIDPASPELPLDVPERKHPEPKAVRARTEIEIPAVRRKDWRR